MKELTLVTGAAGTLGQVIIPLLLQRGDQVRAIDIRMPATRDERVDWRTVDIRDRAAVAHAAEGVTRAVHCAAWHGIHLQEHPPRDFWELNVDGTFTLYDACVSAGTRTVILASTMGVYGAAGAPADDRGAVRIHEGLTPRPTDIYGASKLLCEELAGFHARSGGVRGMALRFGMFVPEPFGHYGVRMLYGGVDERDVASAVLLALDRADAGLPFGAYNIMSALPYTKEDADDLRRDPMAVVRRHWPHAEDLLEHVGANLWGPVNNWYDVRRAQQELGWQPRWNFTEFLGAVSAGVVDASAIEPKNEGEAPKS